MNILEVIKLTDFRHLNLFSIKYIDRTQKLKSWIFASRSEKPPVIEVAQNSADAERRCIPGEKRKPNAVVIVPFHKQYEKLVLIREFRVPLGGYQYGFPAGLVDGNEEIEETASRELKEETGLDICRIIRVSPVIYSSSGMTDECISLVYVECDGEPSLEWNEESEDIEVMMLSRSDAAEIVESDGCRFDVKSWIVLSTFARTGII